jgi:hypothetical protein
MAWKGDTLWVMDLGSNRVNLYEGATAHSGDISFAQAPAFSRLYSPPRAGALLADGSVMSLSSVPSSISSQGLGGDHLLQKVTRTGAVLDTILRLPADGRRQGQVQLRNGQLVPFRMPIDDAMLLRLSHDARSVVVVDRRTGARLSSFSLTRVSVSGDTLAHRSFEYAPLPLRRQQADSLFAPLARSMGATFGLPPAAVVEDILEQVQVPGTFPPVVDLVPGRDQSIWVGLKTQEHPHGSWLVFDEQLQPVARVSIPLDVRVMRVSERFIWGLTTGSLDVPQVVRYRIVKRIPGTSHGGRQAEGAP